jgi:phosphopantothenoylcysteine decarboxylase / phosphopantothenate---cysteine ligase
MRSHGGEEERGTMVQNIFAGKKIVIGVCGSIAAFKVAGWVSDLAKDEADVSVVMTASASEFVTPLTFVALSGNDVHTTMFDSGSDKVMSHISLGRDADMVIVAPATANIIAKLANGIADDLLTTMVLATRAKVLVCPAMNSRMFSHPATTGNMRKLQDLGYTIIDPVCGKMACKEEGDGRLPEWNDVKELVAQHLTPKDLQGVKILVTAGPTREPLDPARYLSNRSSGKMGYAVAQAARRRGADILLVSGPTTLTHPPGVTLIKVQTAVEMYETVLAHSAEYEVIIKAAAVADYRPATVSGQKVKKDNISKEMQLTGNPDILLELGKRKKPGQVLVGFAAESNNFLQEGQRKLRSKNLDLIAVNDIGGDLTGFEVGSNQLTLISASATEILPHTSKLHSADLLLDRVRQLLRP